MEAPEKLYLIQDNGLVCYCRNNKDDIEYTSTDVVIEKAIGWIDYNNRNGGCNFDGWEKDFKKYMEE